MIARTTLALMLAGPAATAILAIPQSAHADMRKPCRDCTSSSATARRVRSDRSVAIRRGAPPPCPITSTGACDDGLAYDTPRDATGLPSPIPLAVSDSAHPGAHPWQTGVASWYGGPRWQGHLTSSGKRYDENALTAAHASLPLGSQCRVRLVGSDREVVVTITDRPGTRSRIIDLSRGAASALGILSRGVARVAVDPI